jgi:CSLREA domain-containing protein
LFVDRRTTSGASGAARSSKPGERRRSRRPGRTALAAVATAAAFLLLAVSAQAATITVTTSADDNTPNDGSVSLREAIQAINNGTAGADFDIVFQFPGVFGVNDTINFDISASGTRQTINVGGTGNGALPALIAPMTINGFSEPGASPNTLANGDNASLLIALDGASAGPNADGILVATSGAGSTIRGLNIFDFSLNGIELQGGGATVAGDDVGFDATGTPGPNHNDGVHISNSSNSIIGGTTQAARNVISGNKFAGVHIVGSTSSPATGNLVQGNFIGTDTSGKAADANGCCGSAAPVGGVDVTGGNANTIGGATAGARNVISGNGSGLRLDDGAENNVVQGNSIGVGADGVSPVPNAGFGLEVRSSDNLAPPLGPGQANEPATSGNVIGLNPNTNFGGLSNLIANNGGDGVVVSENPLPNNAAPISNNGNSILGNSIFANGGKGIHLVPLPLAAEKPNNLLGAPTITAVTPGASSTLVQGTLSLPASPAMALRIELFSSPACDASGFGEGQRFIGFANATTNASGNASFIASASPVAPGQSVTATATNTTADPSAQPGSVNIFNTSEFSRCFVAPAPAPAPSPGSVAGPPSNAFTVISRSVKHGVITLKVQTRTPGALNARATFIRAVKVISGHGRRRHRHTVRQTLLYGQASASTNGVTPAILRIAPTGKAAGLLRSLHTLRLSIKVSFTPTGGRINTIVFPLTVSSPKPKPKHHR